MFDNLSHWEIQIKTTLRLYLIPVRTAKNNNTRDSSYWGCGTRETHIYWCWECKLIQPLWKFAWWFLSKMKITISWSSCSALGHTDKGFFIPPQRYILNHIHRCSTYNSQNWKQLRCLSTGEWIFKKCTFTPWNTTQLLNREKHHEICRHMYGTSRNKNKKQKVHPEWGIPDTERWIWYVFVYMWTLAVKMMIIKLKSIDKQRLSIKGLEEQIYLLRKWEQNRWL